METWSIRQPDGRSEAPRFTERDQSFAIRSSGNKTIGRAKLSGMLCRTRSTTVTSVYTSKPAIRGQGKSGHRVSAKASVFSRGRAGPSKPVFRGEESRECLQLVLGLGRIAEGALLHLFGSVLCSQQAQRE